MISLCEATLTSELNSSLTVCFLPTEEREKYPFRLVRREWGGGGLGEGQRLALGQLDRCCECWVTFAPAKEALSSCLSLQTR